MLNEFEEKDEMVLEEMETIRSKKSKNFNAVVNKRKLNKYEMDDYFMGG